MDSSILLQAFNRHISKMIEESPVEGLIVYPEGKSLSLTHFTASSSELCRLGPTACLHCLRILNNATLLLCFSELCLCAN